MSFAKPPSYKLRKGKPQSNVPKPPKPAGGRLAYTPHAIGTPYKAPHYKLNQSKKPAGVGGSTGATPPVQAPVPPVNAATQNAPITPTPSTPPPETLEGGLARGGATEQYNIGIPDINHQLWEAAFNYGGAPQVMQAGYELDPTTGKYVDSSSMIGVGDNPNSRLATIQRGLTADTTSLSNNLNNANSYFSGAHVEGQGKLDDQAGRDRVQAKQDFDDAMLRLTTLLEQARHDRDIGLGGADITDLQAALDAPPEDRQPGAAAGAAGGLAGNPPPPFTSGPKGAARRPAPHGSSPNRTLTARRGPAMGQIKTPSKNTGLLKKKRK